MKIMLEKVKTGGETTILSKKLLMKLVALSICLVSGLIIQPMHAQNSRDGAKKIEGVVLDVNGEPLTGLVVAVKGTTHATPTDLNGEFTIDVKPSDVLVFTYLGFQTQEIPVSDKTRLNVVMREASIELEDVVVVGYGQQKKISITGAVSNANVHDLQAVPSASFSNALAGQVPGLITRQPSGEPGFDGAALYVRGMGTFTSKRHPIVFVDGVERDINIVNPQEVESLTILKDASSTAVYGVRGANGVILITTKKGKKGKPKVSFRSEYATLAAMRFPEYIEAYEYATLMNEARINSGLTPEFSAEEIGYYRDGTDPYLYPNVDWISEVFKENTWQSSQNLTISGGNENVRYYINLGYIGKDGLYKEDKSLDYKTNGGKFRRYNLRSNVDVDVSKDIELNMGLATTIQDRGYQGASAGNIWDQIRRTPAMLYPVRNPDGSIAGGGATAYLLENPYGQATQTGYTQMFIGHSQGNVNARWDLSNLLAKGLSVSAKFAFDYYYKNEVVRRIAYGVKQVTGKDADENYTYQTWREQGTMGYAVDIQDATYDLYYEAALNYERTFGKHNLGAMLLFNRKEYKLLTAATSIANLPYRHQGLAGRFTYNFNSRYMAEVNMGYNGSEQFPKGNRYGFFPAVSAGWVLSNESFWGIDFINHLKLRGSVGQVGNDQADGDRYLYITALDVNPHAGVEYWYGPGQTRIHGIEEFKFGVPLKWETATKYDAGIDLGILNVFNLTLDIYKEHRTDILLRRATVPGFVGLVPHGIPYGNIGVVDNKGFDASIEFKNKTSYGLTYSFNANISYARNTIIEDDSPRPAEPYQDHRGQPIDRPMGLIAMGLFESQEEIDGWPKSTFKTDLIPGDVKYQDVNNDGFIDAKDEVYMGHPFIPEIMFGFGGAMNYKNFDATVHFSGVANRSTFLTGDGIWPFQLGYGTYNIMREYYDNRWIPGEGVDNTAAKYPTVISTSANVHNNRNSTLYLKDASYLRLQSAEIGYTLPHRWTNAMKLESIRCFLNGSNLLTFDKLKIVDPEQNIGDNYPLQRTINIGAQINF
ncbi:MAG: TonB-dependent receptor [Dysgonamonadaceae bacterium]|jgi:TonB-linked SusC/RagA family outer membrane protein|nr:TonB-dependent receptor [Dysgonamonadaceae bacterium]